MLSTLLAVHACIFQINKFIFNVSFNKLLFFLFHFYRKVTTITLTHNLLTIFMKQDFVIIIKKMNRISIINLGRRTIPNETLPLQNRSRIQREEGRRMTFLLL